MQRHIQQDKARKRRNKTIIGLAAFIVVVVLGTQIISGMIRPRTPEARLLRCSASQSVTAFGDYILYYDGFYLNCISDNNALLWTYHIGADANFSVSENGQRIIAWSGSLLHFIDQNGKATYSENQRQPVQWGRMGETYAAAVIGDLSSPTLMIKDWSGTHADQESLAYENMMIMDMGFFGDRGKYMWTLSLDIYGMVPNYVLNTFEVSKKNTGTIALGDAMVYDVIYDNGVLQVVTSRQLRPFNEKGTENTQATSLIFGWNLIDYEIPQRGNTYMLFAPEAQASSQFAIRDLRLMSGSLDSRYTLPSICVGAVIRNRTLYAFGAEYIYKADVGAQRFTTMNMPSNLSQSPTAYLGITNKNVALLACGQEVYAVTLP